MIPHDWEGTNFYGDLRVEPSASYSEIRKAHRLRVREVHPDIAANEDHSAEFIRISLAYSVLSDEEKRREYDQYLFGQEAATPVDKDAKRRKRAFALLGRVALLCILLLLVRTGAITGGATSNTSSGSGLSHFVTNDSSSPLNVNDNQVLALIVGPQGPPGPAGVAGKNGFIGMNGYQGKDGLPGAPGAVGPQGPKGDAGPQGPAGPAGANGLPGAQGPIGPAGPAGANGSNGANGANGTNGTIGHDGAGVVIVAMPVDSHAAHCPLGGTQLIASDGTTSYACNGTAGSATLTPGTVFGQGRIQIGACDTAVDIALDDSYSGSATDFVMNAIILRSLAGACDGLQLSAYLNTGNSSNIKYGASSTYSLGDVIQCTTILHLDTLSANNVVSLGNPDCVNYSASGKPPFNLHNLSARDIPDVGSALLIEIKQP